MYTQKIVKLKSLRQLPDVRNDHTAQLNIIVTHTFSL